MLRNCNIPLVWHVVTNFLCLLIVGDDENPFVDQDQDSNENDPDENVSVVKVKCKEEIVAYIQLS